MTTSGDTSAELLYDSVESPGAPATLTSPRHPSPIPRRAAPPATALKLLENHRKPYASQPGSPATYSPSTSLHVFQTSKWLPGRLQSSPTKAVEPTTQLVSQSPHRSPSLDKSCRYAIHPLVRHQLSKQWPPSHASLRPATRGNHGRPKSWRRTIRSVGFLVATPKARSTSPLLTMSTDRSASRAPARFCKYDEFNHCAAAAHRVTTVFIFYLIFDDSDRMDHHHSKCLGIDRLHSDTVHHLIRIPPKETTQRLPGSLPLGFSQHEKGHRREMFCFSQKGRGFHTRRESRPGAAHGVQLDRIGF